MTTARELTNQMRSTLGTERAAMAEFLVMLAAFDAEQRWRELDYTSCFYYLRREFRLSEAISGNCWMSSAAVFRLCAAPRSEAAPPRGSRA